MSKNNRKYDLLGEKQLRFDNRTENYWDFQRYLSPAKEKSYKILELGEPLQLRADKKKLQQYYYWEKLGKRIKTYYTSNKQNDFINCIYTIKTKDGIKRAYMQLKGYKRQYDFTVIEIAYDMQL